MYFTDKERDIIRPFAKYLSEDIFTEEKFLLSWKNGTKIYAYYCTTDEDDNGLEPEDPNYEEYTSFIMDIKEINNFSSQDGINLDEIKKYKAIILSYHNFPDEIYNSKGELISKRDNGKFNQDKN